jgi:hypothetical protein
LYSTKSTNQKIERWIRAGKFTPEVHSLAECERAISHFESLVEVDYESERVVSVRNPDARPEETLTKDEVRWIENETLLCRIDFRYWVSRYVFIKNDEDAIFRFTPWMSQSIFLDIIAEMEDEQIAIFLIILKARQLGISRIISLILLHRVIFYDNRNAFLASSTEDKTRLLFDMLDFTLFRLPWWMRPQEKFRREGKLLELYNGSGVTLQHGQQGTGIARGTTPTVAHISELAEFDDPSSLIDSSLLRAMHPSPNSFLGLEGTAEGINNWWHKKWKTQKALWPERRGRLRPLFLPWFVGGLYPKAADLRARPIPHNYEQTMLPWAKAHAQMAEAYVHSTDYLRRHLGENWQMPIEQVWYYETERDAAIREGRLSRFLQEMPANDDEAFQSTNISVFDTDTLVYYRDHAHRTPLAGCYGLRGPSDYLPARLQPSPLLVDNSLPTIPVTADWSPNTPPLQFELVPLRFDGWSLEDDSSSIDKIYIWEQPMSGFEYGLGIDTSDGIGKDRTVIEILRKSSIYGPTKQVGEFASSKMNALDSVPFALALGTYFSVPDAETGELRQPRMAIECRGHGDQAQGILRMLGWRNFHPWVDRQIDSRKIELNKFNKLGVFTNEWFRAGMIEMLTKMLRDAEIEISSPFFVREMESLEGDEFSQSLRAGYGGNDDRIMALGFILVSLYRFDMDRFRTAKIAAYSGRAVSPRNAPRQYASWPEGWASKTDEGIYRA